MNEKQKFEVMMYIKKKLESFGCPDSYIQRTADSMTNTIEQILKENEELKNDRTKT